MIKLHFQRQLRLADAKQVETKAARIKDWVTNKLRELEEQNRHLRAQNEHCNEQMELLRQRLEQLQQLGAEQQQQRMSSSAGASASSRLSSVSNVLLNILRVRRTCLYIKPTRPSTRWSLSETNAPSLIQREKEGEAVFVAHSLFLTVGE